MLKWLITTVSALVGLVAAGGATTGAAPDPEPEDVLFLRSGNGVTLVRGLPEGVAVRIPRGVPSPDWSAVVRAVPQGSETQVVVLDPRSGQEQWTRDVPGKLEVEVASQDGRLVALGSRGAVSGYAGGRSSTTLVIASRDDPEPRTIRLDGNFQPEAFSTDGGSLFVVEYLPPENPTSYRVRRLDLETQEVGGVYTVDAELQEAMQGTARIQTSSPDGGRLYTLYTIRDHGTSHSFVHVLSLDEEWAHCVDLPPTFGTRSEKSVALAVGPAGKRLYVVDTSTGALAEVDTTALTVTRTSDVEFGAGGGAAHAATGPDGAVFLGNGNDLLAVDASTLDTRHSWGMGKRITGIQAGSDAGRLYVGLRDEIVILDPRSGETVGVIHLDGLGIIDQLGQSTEPLEEERTNIECAC